MNETYSLASKSAEGLTIVLPSLSMDQEKFAKRLRGSRSTICIINYSGFGDSKGSFPGTHILENVNALIGKIEKLYGRKTDRIIGDSYGGLIALGLLSKYTARYRNTDFILTSPLISFERLNKDPASSQSKEGFVRYLSNHKLIRKISNRQLQRLVAHKEIPDPFMQKLKTKRLTIYHYTNDKSLNSEVSKDFSIFNKSKYVRLKGNRHSLARFKKSDLNRVLNL